MLYLLPVSGDGRSKDDEANKTHVWHVCRQQSGRIERLAGLDQESFGKPLICLKTLITISGPDGARRTLSNRRIR